MEGGNFFAKNLPEHTFEFRFSKINSRFAAIHFVFLFLRFASSYAGQNGFTAPGADEVMTTSEANDEATASGTFTSDSNGEALFQFRRIAHHVHLSAISIASECEGNNVYFFWTTLSITAATSSITVATSFIIFTP